MVCLPLALQNHFSTNIKTVLSFFVLPSVENAFVHSVVHLIFKALIFVEVYRINHAVLYESPVFCSKNQSMKIDFLM